MDNRKKIKKSNAWEKEKGDSEKKSPADILSRKKHEKAREG